MPSSRPRISFDEHGIYNACNYQILKKKIDGVKDKKNLRRFVINIDQQTEIYDCDCSLEWWKRLKLDSLQIKNFEHGDIRP